MSILSYKCPNCGGRLDFDPDLQKCKCPYCLSAFTAQEISGAQPFDNAPPEAEKTDPDASGDDFEENTRMFSCPSCGAQIVTDLVTAATHCCYCHNPVLVAERLSGALKPSMVVPFSLNRDNAVLKLREWCGKKKLLPGDYLSGRQLENVTGIYIPYWLMDCEAHGTLNAEGQIRTTWQDARYIHTKTDIYDCSRQADFSFRLIPHDASKKADDRVMDSIEPFDYSGIKPFSMSYLTGFLAEKYDVEKQAAADVLRPRVSRAVKSVLMSSVKGYSAVHERASRVDFKAETLHYALLPIWMMTYIYHGKTYMYAMNGQTGKAFGILPVSRVKMAILFASLALGVFALTFLIAMLGVLS